MNIQQWIDGKLKSSQSVETCRQVARVLKRNGWAVLELYDIHMLVLFSPEYGEAKKGPG